MDRYKVYCALCEMPIDENLDLETAISQAIKVEESIPLKYQYLHDIQIEQMEVDSE